MLERSCNGTSDLLFRHYVLEESYWSMTPREQDRLREGVRAFRRELQAAGFLPIPEHGDGEDRGV